MTYHLKNVVIDGIILIILLGSNSLAGKIDDFNLKDLENKRVSFSDLKGEKIEFYELDDERNSII